MCSVKMCSVSVHHWTVLNQKQSLLMEAAVLLVQVSGVMVDWPLS